MAHIDLVVEKLYNNKDFDYLFNKKVFTCYGGRTAVGYWGSLNCFVEEFCERFPYFPASVVSSTSTAAPSPEEINSVVQYIMDFLFICSCIDIFTTKARSGPILGKDDFETFKVISHWEFARNFDGIHFYMHSQEKDLTLIVRIRLPEFTVNKYETFNSITEFKNSTRTKMDILSSTVNLIDMHLVVGTSTLLSAFPQFLLDQLHEFVIRNEL